MRMRELFPSNILIAITNEEARFLKKHHTNIIDIDSLDHRESRILENLIFKDVLCKVNDNQAMLKYHASQYTQTDS
jgi:hypothetical protein